MEEALKKARHNAYLLSSVSISQEEKHKEKENELRSTQVKMSEQEADLRSAQAKLQDMKNIEQSVNYCKVRCSVVAASAKRQSDECKKKLMSSCGSKGSWN